MFVASVFAACSDDDKIGFDLPVDVSQEAIRFTPAPGGAVMHYSLPEDKEVFGIRVRYNSVWGETVVKDGSYLNDSLLLDGFTKAQDVSARISFVNHRDEESTLYEYNFKTLDSAPWTFFDNVEIHSSWNGFQVIYKSPAVVTGMAHVFYLGVDPKTQKPDTILMRSFPILQGGDTLNFAVQQESAKNTVVIRTEDFQGYRVRQEIYPDVDAFPTEQWTMKPENFNDFGLSLRQACSTCLMES